MAPPTPSLSDFPHYTLNGHKIGSLSSYEVIKLNETYQKNVLYFVIEMITNKIVITCFLSKLVTTISSITNIKQISPSRKLSRFVQLKACLNHLL